MITRVACPVCDRPVTRITKAVGQPEVFEPCGCQPPMARLTVDDVEFARRLHHDAKVAEMKGGWSVVEEGRICPKLTCTQLHTMFWSHDRTWRGDDRAWAAVFATPELAIAAYFADHGVVLPMPDVQLDLFSGGAL